MLCFFCSEFCWQRIQGGNMCLHWISSWFIQSPSYTWSITLFYNSFSCSNLDFNAECEWTNFASENMYICIYNKISWRLSLRMKEKANDGCWPQFLIIYTYIHISWILFAYFCIVYAFVCIHARYAENIKALHIPQNKIIKDEISFTECVLTYSPSYTGLDK